MAKKWLESRPVESRPESSGAVAVGGVFGAGMSRSWCTGPLKGFYKDERPDSAIGTHPRRWRCRVWRISSNRFGGAIDERAHLIQGCRAMGTEDAVVADL